MYEFEIKNIVNIEDESFPKVELHLVKPIKMLASPELSLTYKNKTEFAENYILLVKKKQELEKTYNKEVESKEVKTLKPSLKKELLSQVEDYLKSFDQSSIGMPNSRIL